MVRTVQDWRSLGNSLDTRIGGIDGRVAYRGREEDGVEIDSGV